MIIAYKYSEMHSSLMQYEKISFLFTFILSWQKERFITLILGYKEMLHCPFLLLHHKLYIATLP